MFSKQPAVSTYQTKSIKLATELDSRSSAVTKDPQFLNVLFEKPNAETKLVNIVKRAGTEDYGPTLPFATCRGLHYWEDQNRIFLANDNDILIINAVDGSLIITLTNVFTTTTGDVGFTEFLYENNTVVIVATDGTTMLTIDAGHAVITGSDPDMPQHLPQPIFMDGYIFVIKTGSADIYNSDLNAPLSWTPGNFLVAEMFADTVIRLAKLNNYLVVFGSSSVEYYWDAGIATGSPLQRNDTPVKLVGYLGGFAQNGNRIYFVGNTNTGLPEIFYLEDFKIEAIGTDPVRKYLESLTADLTSTIGTVVSFLGHDFYVMNVATSTYVYDITTQKWTRWSWKVFTNFTIEQAVSVRAGSSYTSLIYINSMTKLVKFNSALYQDSGIGFPVEIITALQYFDTMNRKFMYRLSVVGDRPTGTANISVSWTDDDYQTYTSARTVNLNQDIPSLWQLGRFRRRAFKLNTSGNFPLRLSSLEVDINLGQT